MPPSVFKRDGRKNYYASIQGRVVSTGESDQRVALKIATEMESVGIEAYRKGKRTLGEYLPDLIELHLKHLKDVDGRDKTHIRKKRQMLMLPIEQGIFKQLKHVSKQTFEPWWSELPSGPKTRNEYLTAWFVFLDWLVYEGKLNQNPLRGRIKRAKVPRHSDRARRAYTPEEISRLLSVAGKHELLYLTAIGTGARFNELKQLLWEDVHEAEPEPFITLRPETTKNRKGRVQFISHELASQFAEARNKAKTDKVFRQMPSDHTINKHISQAGIEKKTDEGIACFHSLRHTYTTTIARMTKDPRVAQRMADHADITTTQRYLHTGRSEQAEVMAQFPRFRSPERAVKRAVGVVQSGQNETNDGLSKSIVERSQVSGNEPFRPAKYGRVQDGPRMEPGGIEPPSRCRPRSASTCVVICLISTSHREMTPCALVQPLETSSPTPQEAPSVDQPDNRDHVPYQTSSP